ncbi:MULTISPECIES: TspO/MBR family protein [unclassified Polaribacter]|jgi:tryptophan-rich sensory protein|uniref:TspO/MBR family protein n=1 Tax=unclassified Polaribacter TaxID=196858 RepID=UPI00052CE05B|nr:MULTISPECIES: TspO/MBR family protein [unclassified Polaribacter]KGL60341.1 TspO/MBR family protein [Polaribacter sp. Hel1_33_49]MBT3741549.1 tryptophan-rich sensory protein [Polaribacter sp.]PKV65362.1 TspO/MBR related protein [Polaribacter sp. Hel1_33_96]
MKQVKLTFLFLILNFGGLAIGSWLMNNGPTTDWYTNLNQASWTPPGWVFGVAWTSIMICFSLYLGKLFTKDYRSKLIFVFLVQFILNVSWNYIFFNQRLILFGLITIVLLTSLIFYYFFKLSKNTSYYKFLLLPYMIWLCIATSLNLYILIHN